MSAFAPIPTQDVRSDPIPHAVPTNAPLYVVLNVGSGKHAGEDVRGSIEATLSKAGRSFFIHEITDPEALAPTAKDVVQRAKMSGGIVVAAGGDGTINTVAEATLGSGCPFGVIPLGTFNYFSRTHGIPSDVPAACQMLLTRRAYEVQVGLVNDRVFLVNASIGLYPELLEEREQAKQRLGRSRWVALGAALATLLRPHRSLRIEMEAKGLRETFVTPTLFVGNNRLQLARVGIPEGELVEHHRLVAVIMRPVGFVGKLALLLRAVFGRLGDEARVVSFAFARLTVRARFGARGFKVAMDGETTWLRSPLTFRIAPHPLILLRPADPGDDPG